MDTVYIDSNIFLNPLLYSLEEIEAAKKCAIFLEDIIQKKIKAITSTLTWDEVIWILKKTLGKAAAEQKGKEFLVFPNLSFKKISHSTINRAQKLLSKYNLRPRDLIHVACALENQVHIIYSLDADFDTITEIKRKTP
ncbi:MAG: type II toxin-antitoxin system VapC family toxin [Promethearchaeia archaeon]